MRLDEMHRKRGEKVYCFSVRAKQYTVFIIAFCLIVIFSMSGTTSEDKTVVKRNFIKKAIEVKDTFECLTLENTLGLY